MKDADKIISGALGILESDPIEKSIKEQSNVPRVVPATNEDDIDNDYKYQRENLYNLIERGQDAIDGILELAKESEHPRTYEVAGQLIKNVAEVTEKLMQLQNDMKKLKEVPSNAPKNVTNALFVGSTAELQKALTGKGRIIDADIRKSDTTTV